MTNYWGAYMRPFLFSVRRREGRFSLQFASCSGEMPENPADFEPLVYTELKPKPCTSGNRLLQNEQAASVAVQIMAAIVAQGL